MPNSSFRDIELNLKKELRNSLQGIWGVGWHRSSYALAKLGFAYPFWANNLNYYLFNSITFVLNRLLLSKAKAQRQLDLTLKTLIEFESYRGKRHQLHLPTRGQRTRTNGRTMKRLSRLTFKKSKKYGQKTRKKK